MSRIAPTSVSAVRPRVTSELHSDGKPRPDVRGRSRDMTSRRTDASQVPQVPNIQQLRSRFQTEDVPKTTSAPTVNRSTATGMPNVPEIRLPASQKRTSPVDSVLMADPEKYFESTNHTQRFQHTRAIFAKMEEQTRLDQERRRQLFYRSKSPTRFPMTSTSSLVISPATGASDANSLMLSPSSSSDSDNRSPAAKSEVVHEPVCEPRTDRPRVMSASADIRQGKLLTTSPPAQTVRSSSVDRLDDDAPYEPCSLTQSAKFTSRSETDLLGSNREDVPSPKWLMQHYENVVQKNAALFGGQVIRRRPPLAYNNVRSETSDSHIKDEESKLPASSVERKLQTSGSQSDAKVIPPNMSYNHQNHSEPVSAPKVPTTSTNVTQRYGRPAEQPQSSLASAKPAASVSATVNKPDVSNLERKDQVSAARPAVRSAEDDDSVARSFEAWKTRRRVGNKDEELEQEQMHLTSDEKPSLVTDHQLNAINSTGAGQGTHTETIGVESTKPTVTEQPSIFGVTLRSTVSESEDREAKSQPELVAEVGTTKVPAVDAAVESHSLESFSSPHAEEENRVGEQAKPDGETLVDLQINKTEKDMDVVSDEVSSDRRLSLELSDVPHFPKDSVMLTGGHLSVSPRSSYTENHHPPPSFPDLKTDDDTEDSVFTHAEPSSRQPNNYSVPSTSTKAESVPPAEHAR